MRVGCDGITIAAVGIESHSFAKYANEWGTRLEKGGAMLAAHSTRNSQTSGMRLMGILILVLSTPGAVSCVVGMPVVFLGVMRIWPSNSDSIILSFLDRIATGAGLVTMIGGWLTTPIAFALLLRIRSFEQVPRARKTELSILVGLSAVGTVFMLFAMSHMWG